MLIIKQPLHVILLVFMLLGLVACGGGESSDPGSTSTQLSRIELQVDSDALPTNSKMNITAIAYYDNNTNENVTPIVDWSVNDESLATINANGELNTKSMVNSVEVFAKYKNLSVSKTFNITPTLGAKVLQLSIDPVTVSNLSVDQEIAVTTIYDDGSIQENVTVKVESIDTQQSTPKVILKVSTADVEITIPDNIDPSQALTLPANVLSAADTPVTVQSIDILSSTTSLTSGDIVSISVEAIYSDSSTAAINDSISFSVTGPIVVSDDKSSIIAQDVSSVTTATLTAEINGLSVSKEFSIQPAQSGGTIIQATLESILLQVGKSTLLSNETTTISATGNYNDGSTKDLTGNASWSSSNTLVATVDAATGKVIPGSETGTTTITASIDNISDSTTLTVNATTATLDKLVLNNSSLSINKGSQSTLTLTAQFSDNSSFTPTQGVTWSSSNTQVITVNNGIVSAVAAGSGKITASYQGKNIIADVTVIDVPVTLSNITINASKLSLKTNESLSVTASGNYSDKSSKDISADVVWESSDSNIISIDKTSGIKLVAQNAEGPVTITASSGNVSKSLNFNVSKPATITGIRINKTTLPLNTNSESGVLQVYADFSDGTESNITNEVTWSSTNSNVVSVDSVGYLKSYALTGEVTINATYSPTNETVSSTITVSIPTSVKIQSVYIANPPGTLFFNQNHSLSLHAILDDKSDIVLEQNVTWSITDGPAAKINSAGIVATSNIKDTVIVNAAYKQSVDSTPFYNSITISIEPENSFDNFNIKLADLPQKTVIEDNSNFAPQLKAFYNPVGITQEFPFTVANPGTFLSYSSEWTDEQLVLVLTDTTAGVYDKSTAKLFYIPENNKDLVYELDTSASTSLNVNLVSYGTSGEIANGQFNAILCLKKAIALNTCSLAENQLKLSGSFYITIEAESAFRSNFSINNPLLVDVNSMSVIQQISNESNYYYVNTTKGVVYHFLTDNNEIMIDVVNSADKATVIASSTQRSQETGQELTYSATETKTYLKLTYTGSGNGSTYKLTSTSDGLIAQGSANSPFVISHQGMPKIFDQGTVDSTISYYVVDVLVGYKYRIVIQDANNKTYPNTPISLEVSETNTAEAYTPCSLSNCEIVSTLGKLYLKVIGESTSGASFTINVEYAPERDVEVALPLTEQSGQVGSNHGYNSPQDGPFNVGNSNYWIPVSQLAPNRYYLISFKGLKSSAVLWIQNQSSTLAEICTSGYIQNSFNNELYCVVKTKPSFSFLNYGFAITLQSYGSGTPYSLSISEFDVSQAFFVSTYANRATGDIGIIGSNAPSVSLYFYRQGEDKPFASELANVNNNYAKKILLLSPGEKVFVLAKDNYNNGNFYSIRIQKNEFHLTKGSATLVNDPDEYELGVGDNSIETATVIQLDQETNHSFSYNNGQFGDEDWFSFTAP